MKRTRKIFALLLSICMIVTMLPTVAFAADPAETPQIVKAGFIKDKATAEKVLNATDIGKSGNVMYVTVKPTQATDRFLIEVEYPNNGGTYAIMYGNGKNAMSPNGKNIYWGLDNPTQYDFKKSGESWITEDKNPTGSHTDGKYQLKVYTYTYSGDGYPTQWSGIKDLNQIGETLTIDTSLTQIEKADIVFASLADNSSEDTFTSDNLITSKKVTVTTAGQDEYNVSLEGTDLNYHKNGEGKNGYWVGFAVKAPTDVETVSYSFDGGKVATSTPVAVEKAVDGDEANGITFYYDAASTTKTDTVKVQFFGENNNALTPETTFNVDFSKVTLNTRTIKEIGFTYDVDKEVVNDCANETLWVKLDKPLGTGHYLIVVNNPDTKQPQRAIWYHEDGDNTASTKIAWSYVNPTQSTGTGAAIGEYTVDLYAYTGKFDSTNEANQEAIEAAIANGIKLDSKTINVIGIANDGMDVSATVKSQSEETASTSPIAVTKDVTSKKLVLSGDVINLPTEGLNLTLTFDAGIDKVDKDVTLTYDSDQKKWTANPASITLLTKEGAYTIDPTNLTVVDMPIVTGESEVTNPNKVDSDIVTAVEKTEANSEDLANLAADVAKTEAAKVEDNRLEETTKNKFAAADIQVDDKTIQYFVEPYLDIEITGYQDGKLTLDIKAEYNLIATTAEKVEEAQVNGREGVTSANSVIVEEKQPLTVSTPIELTVGVPANFLSETSTPYVQHIKNGSHYHSGTYINNTVTFTSSDGLSPFVLDANANVVAQIGETYYESLQAAVDAANDNDTIILLKACDPATVNKAITLTLEADTSASDVSITEDTLIAGNSVTKKYDSATKTFTFTKPNTGGSGVNANHKVIVDSSITNGTVTADKSDNVAKGTTVTLTVTPKEGYVLDDLTVKTSSGTVQTTTKVNDTTYTFSMPAADVIVTATFKLAEPEEDTVCKPYSDIVTSGSDGWYHEYVHYMIQNGLMTGVEADKFAPKMNLNRAMVAQILYAKANKPTVTATAKFSDVPADRWFTSAVSWAAENGAVSGYTDGTFKPMQAVTREELAVMLYGKESKPTVTGNELAAFADTSSISSWAQSAMLWVVQKGIMDGDNNNKLNPKATATRAEAATMLYKYFAK